MLVVTFFDSAWPLVTLLICIAGLAGTNPQKSHPIFAGAFRLAFYVPFARQLPHTESNSIGCRFVAFDQGAALYQNKSQHTCDIRSR